MIDSREKLMEYLVELPTCALLPMGRTGSDFLQSMLDSHPEVLTFNGHMLFHTFWASSTCVRAGDFAVRDLVDEFIGRYIEKLKSRYDLMERKNQLGADLDQTIDIDLDRFRCEVEALLENREVTSRTFLLAINGAYALCLGQDLSKKKLFFHHPHLFSEMPPYLRDFPNSKIVCMTRDPRANFVSGIEHHRNHNIIADTDNAVHLLFQINRILNDAVPLEKYGNDYRVIRIEDLGEVETLYALCRWLDISYDQCLTASTWAGLSWHGDRMSKVNRQTGFSPELLQNQWENRLSFTDKYVMNYILNPRLKFYGYGHRKISIMGVIAVPFLILLPLSYELRFMTPAYLRDCFRKDHRLLIPRNALNYLRRISLFMRFYVRVTKGRKFNQPLLRPEPSAITASPVEVA